MHNSSCPWVQASASSLAFGCSLGLSASDPGGGARRGWGRGKQGGQVQAAYFPRAGCRGGLGPSSGTGTAGVIGGSAWALAPGRRGSWNQAQLGAGGGQGHPICPTVDARQGWLRERKVAWAPTPAPLCTPLLLPGEEATAVFSPGPGLSGQSPSPMPRGGEGRWTQPAHPGTRPRGRQGVPGDKLLKIGPGNV